MPLHHVPLSMGVLVMSFELNSRIATPDSLGFMWRMLPIAQGDHLGSPQPEKAPRTCGNVSPAVPARKLDAGREAAGALEHAADTMPLRPRGDLSRRLPAAGSEARPLGYSGPWTHWDLNTGSSAC